jgi:hypothetical protein
MKEYFVKVFPGYVQHDAATNPAAQSAYEGLWIWHAPTLAVNYYGEGLSLERIVPTGPGSMEIRYQYLFRRVAEGDPDAAQKRRDQQSAIDTSTEVLYAPTMTMNVTMAMNMS